MSISSNLYRFKGLKQGMNDFLLTMSNVSLILKFGLSFLFLLVCLLVFRNNKKSTQTKKAKTTGATIFYGQSRTIPNVKPVRSDFSWDKESPLKSFPFRKGIYKLTMGIRSLNFQDWLLMELNYLKNINIKSSIVSNTNPNYPSEKNLSKSSVCLTEECIPSLKELYSMVVPYMCDKYPMHFSKTPNNEQVYNSVTKEYIPLDPNSVDEPYLLLKYLSRTIEEDFIILQKDDSQKEKPHGSEYHFKGGVFAFPVGFDPGKLFNKPLSFIHQPVPGYEQKLKPSLNKFFDRLEPGNFVTRSNWFVQAHNYFFVDELIKEGNAPPRSEMRPLRRENLDFEKQVHYRSERQVLTRLPKLGAVVFTIRTYLLPMSEIKNEDEATIDRFVGAIEGLPDDLAYYKRSLEWGPPVIEYLLDSQKNEDKDVMHTTKHIDQMLAV